MSEERKRPRISRASVNRDEERDQERSTFGIREGEEGGGFRFERRRRDFGEAREGFRPRGGSRFGYIRDLSQERENAREDGALDGGMYEAREGEGEGAYL